MTAFDLLSWNVAGRVRRAEEQVQEIANLAPDVVALQEVTLGNLPILRSGLSRIGFEFVVDSVPTAASGLSRTGPRRYGQLVASRFPIVPCGSTSFQIPWTERVLSVVCLLPELALELHVVHVPPGSSNGWIKIETLEGLLEGLTVPSSALRVVCGDFNTPQAELADGTIVTWGQRMGRSGHSDPTGRWDRAERRVLTELGSPKLVDVYRHLYGTKGGDSSWVFHRGALTVSRRYDHVFAHSELRPLAFRYIQGPRERGLSDHAVVQVSFSGLEARHIGETDRGR